MSDPIVILTEEPLGPEDRANIAKLLDGGDAPLVVLVPANTERHLLVDFLENLSLLDIAKAFRDLGPQSHDPEAERAEASEALAASLTSLAGLGGGVTGEIELAVVVNVAAVRGDDRLEHRRVGRDREALDVLTLRAGQLGDLAGDVLEFVPGLRRGIIADLLEQVHIAHQHLRRVLVCQRHHRARPKVPCPFSPCCLRRTVTERHSRRRRSPR